MKFDFETKVIHRVPATDFVQKYHYSPVMPGITKYHLGFYLENKLSGVLTLGWGTKPRHTFNKMFPTAQILEKKDGEWIVPSYDITKCSYGGWVAQSMPYGIFPILKNGKIGKKPCKWIKSIKLYY